MAMTDLPCLAQTLGAKAIGNPAASDEPNSRKLGLVAVLGLPVAEISASVADITGKPPESYQNFLQRNQQRLS